VVQLRVALIQHVLMRPRTRARLVVIALALLALGSASQPEVRVTLVPSAGAVGPGGRLQLAVHYVVEPGWHIYWENPGDSGLATSLDVTAPGWTVGPVRYPGPYLFSGDGDLVSYGWAGSTALLVDLVAPSEVGPAEVLISTRWLACKDVCVVGEAERTVRVTVTQYEASAALGTAARFEEWRRALPRPELVSAAWTCTDAGAVLRFQAAASDVVQVFPTVEFDEAGGSVRVGRTGDETTVALDVPGPRPAVDSEARWGVLRAGKAWYELSPPCAAPASFSAPEGPP
jgi:thiol:disulfide interchange protein DsbD